ncbi:MAG: diguanylate cyclase [Bacteroides sp. SM23_62_1]|nr:MAG: diguanylate cyclase [Bacteroides sp. SM23_62_1]
MIDLTTNYAGLKLRNPIIISSSGLTDSVEKIMKLDASGAGAVVLKSLFEEQIKYETGTFLQTADYPEAEDYLRYYVRSNNVDDYLRLIEGAKKNVSIPVIASVNCISQSEWTDFSKKIETAGADALELNVYFLPVDKKITSQSIENLYLQIADKVRELIRIPVTIKLGQQFTNLVNLVDQLYFREIKGVVLFNRFYSPDINIHDQKIISSDVFSTPADIRYSLRWVAILSHFVDQIDLAASTGIHDGKAVIKQLLAGAKAVQVCSAIYKKGTGLIQEMLSDVESWMKKNSLQIPEQFIGKMNYGNVKDPAVYERAQFMKYFSSHN